MQNVVKYHIVRKKHSVVHTYLQLKKCFWKAWDLIKIIVKLYFSITSHMHVAVNVWRTFLCASCINLNHYMWYSGMINTHTHTHINDIAKQLLSDNKRGRRTFIKFTLRTLICACSWYARVCFVSFVWFQLDMTARIPYQHMPEYCMRPFRVLCIHVFCLLFLKIVFDNSDGISSLCRPHTFESTKTISPKDKTFDQCNLLLSRYFLY